jgi:hypothetical protein
MEKKGEEFIVTCPHCKEFVVIQEINCGIFRNGTLHNGNQMEPHAPKEQCDEYVNKKLIYGCGGPFKLVKKDDSTFEAVICDYI